jgi:hypothetical protein
MATSDRNKIRIQSILNDLNVESNRTLEKVEAHSKELMALLEIEGLESHRGSFESILAGIYVQIHNVVKAREYARMAVESQIRFRGYDDESVDSARATLERLESLETD